MLVTSLFETQPSRSGFGLEALRHPDGTPVYCAEETKPFSSRAPRMEAERPKQRRWNGVDDPISHCLAGNRAPERRPDHIVARLREQGEAPGVQDALLRAEPGPGGADGRPLGAQVARGQRAKAGLAGGGGDHAAGLRGAERREVPAAGRLPAVDSDPGIFNFGCGLARRRAPRWSRPRRG